MIFRVFEGRNAELHLRISVGATTVLLVLRYLPITSSSSRPCSCARFRVENGSYFPYSASHKYCFSVWFLFFFLSPSVHPTFLRFTSAALFLWSSLITVNVRLRLGHVRTPFTSSNFRAVTWDFLVGSVCAHGAQYSEMFFPSCAICNCAFHTLVVVPPSLNQIVHVYSSRHSFSIRIQIYGKRKVYKAEKNSSEKCTATYRKRIITKIALWRFFTSEFHHEPLFFLIFWFLRKLLFFSRAWGTGSLDLSS